MQRFENYILKISIIKPKYEFHDFEQKLSKELLNFHIYYIIIQVFLTYRPGSNPTTRKISLDKFLISPDCF